METKNIQNTEAVFVDAVQELIDFCNQEHDGYPKEIIDRIIQEKELATPKLLEIATRFVEQPFEKASHDNEWLIGITTFYLLAKLKEKQAFPLLIKLCELPPHSTEHVLGDVVTESLHAMLASTYNGNLHELNRIATNQYLNEYARGAAMSAHLILYKYEIISREQMIQILQQWFVEFVHDYSHIPSALVNCCYYIQAKDLAPEIENYYTKGLIDPFYISKENIEEQFALSYAEALKQFHEYFFYNYIETEKRSMEWLFRANDDKELSDKDDILFDENDDEECCDDCDGECYPGCTEYCPGPSIKPATKISRNAQCPCGSGKKYKKCCDALPF